MCGSERCYNTFAMAVAPSIIKLGGNAVDGNISKFCLQFDQWKIIDHRYDKISNMDVMG